MAQTTAPIAATTSTGSHHKGHRMRQIFGRDWKIALPFILPIVILMSLFIAWPFVKALYTSMTIRTMSREVKFVGLDNYIRLYSDTYYWQSVKATFIFTFGSIIFKLIFGLIAALLLHSLKRGPRCDDGTRAPSLDNSVCRAGVGLEIDLGSALWRPQPATSGHRHH